LIGRKEEENVLERASATFIMLFFFKLLSTHDVASKRN
jgi:hypothetical protein